ncbi:hypothetical protein CS369_22350, partial [Candidatus Symbiopectobacterium sp. 'North America']|nr:hypothetical protein [Candidatus Symbiopectobacterium sp. 'North America']
LIQQSELLQVKVENACVILDGIIGAVDERHSDCGERGVVHGIQCMNKKHQYQYLDLYCIQLDLNCSENQNSFL